MPVNQKTKNNSNGMTQAKERRRFINTKLQDLEKHGHELVNMVIIHTGIGEQEKQLVGQKTKFYDGVEDIPKKIKMKSADGASSKAHSILTDMKVKCEKGPGGDVIVGNAIKITHKGGYAAIIVDKNKSFQKEKLPAGVMLLSKHLTAQKKNQGEEAKQTMATYATNTRTGI